jgi:hypothetical protein
LRSSPGRISAKLDTPGLAENTIVLSNCDNGCNDHSNSERT